MTEDSAAAPEVRAEAALQGVTPGPWVVEVDDDEVAVGAGSYLADPGRYTSTDLIHVVDVYGIGPDDGPDHATIVADAEFIAAARSLVPALAAEVRRLQALVAAADSLAETMLNEHGQSWNAISGRRIRKALGAVQ